jgi:hypothetical protein
MQFGSRIANKDGSSLLPVLSLTCSLNPSFSVAGYVRMDSSIVLAEIVNSRFLPKVRTKQSSSDSKQPLKKDRTKTENRNERKRDMEKDSNPKQKTEGEKQENLSSERSVATNVNQLEETTSANTISMDSVDRSKSSEGVGNGKTRLELRKNYNKSRSKPGFEAD